MKLKIDPNLFGAGLLQFADNLRPVPIVKAMDFYGKYPRALPASARQLSAPARARAPAPASIIFLMFTGLSLSSPVSKRSTSYPVNE